MPCGLSPMQLPRRFPKAPLFAAGYSLGALILTKYLAEADTGKWPGEGGTTPVTVQGPCGNARQSLRAWRGWQGVSPPACEPACHPCPRDIADAQRRY